MEKMTKDVADKAVEMLKELGVSSETVEMVQNELSAKMFEAHEKKDETPEEKQEGKEIEFSIGSDGKDTL